MDNLSVEIYVVLAGIAVVALAWFLLRFGKIIARWALVFGGLAAVIIVGLALLSQTEANKEVARTATMAVEAATVTGAGLSIGAVISVIASTFCVGGLGVALLLALGGAGYLWVRWRLAEHKTQTQLSTQRRLPSASNETEDRWKRQHSPPQTEPVIYVLNGDGDGVTALDSFELEW